MYALFEGNKQIGDPFPSEKEVWEAALIEGLDLGVVIRGQRKRHRFEEHVRFGFGVSCRGD